MKKIIVILLLLVFATGPLHAVTGPTEEDYQNLTELREKLVRMKRDMDKFMKEIMVTAVVPGEAIVSTLVPDVKVDVTETNKEIIVKADLPGMDKNKTNVVLDDGKVLKISGERKAEKEEVSSGVIRQERMQGKFERVLELPAECINSGIRASYINGVLDIILQKKEETKPQEVKIDIQ